MPEPLIDDAVATILAGAPGLGAAWIYNNADHTINTIFLGPLRPQDGGIPAAAVFVMASGGRGPVPFVGGASAGSYYHHRIQILVRGAPQDWLGTRALATAARALVHKAALAGITGFIQCLAQQSEPIYIGPDEARNHLFSINVEVERNATP